MRILTKRWRLVFLAVPLAAIAALLVIFHPWNNSPDYQTVMAKTLSAAVDIESFRMTFSGRTVSGVDDSSGTLEAEVAGPDSYHIRITSEGSSQEYIILGDKRYLKSDSPYNGANIGFNPTSFLHTFEGSSLDMLIDPQQLPDEKVGEADCRHYRGQVDMEKRIEAQKQSIRDAYTKDGKEPPSETELETATAGMKEMKMEVEVWVGKDDYFIRQLKQDLQIPDMDSDGTIRIGMISVNVTQIYSDFNQAITIQPPTDSNGQLLPGWTLEDRVLPAPTS